MRYRNIGKTGMKAGIVGLGCEHLDSKPYKAVEETVHAALDRGVNMLDLFMPGEEVRRHIGRALAGRRDKVLLQGHIGSVDLNRQYDVSRDLAVCKKYFEDLLRFLGTDYIDFGMLFFIDGDEDFDGVFGGEILEYVKDLKRRGTVRAIGASSHNPKVAARIVESGEVDLLMFSINPAFDRMPAPSAIEELLERSFSREENYAVNPERERLYRLCESRGVAITVMKTLGAGKLLSDDHTPFAGPLTVAQCIHYALTRPAVVSALVGCESRRQVQEALAYLDSSEEEKDYAPVISSGGGGFQGSCVYCSHCLPCPAEIDVASVNRFVDVASLDGSSVSAAVAAAYENLSRHGSDCIACGSCEARCPFGVPVIANMKRAEKFFGR